MGFATVEGEIAFDFKAFVICAVDNDSAAGDVEIAGVEVGLYFFLDSRRKGRRIKELVSENQQASDGVLYFKADHKTVCVDVGKIIYVESMSEYIKIYMADTDEPLIVLYSLKRLIGQLPARRFMRIHRSYIISLEHVSSASRTSVLMDSGRTLPVGESYRAVFGEYLASL